MQTLQLNTRLSNKSWVRGEFYLPSYSQGSGCQLGDENSDEEDPFAEVCDHHMTEDVVVDPLAQIDEGFAEDDLETNLQRDKNARLCNTVNQLIDELTPSSADFQLRDACDQLVSYVLV
jgi:hypothetical protein